MIDSFLFLSQETRHLHLQRSQILPPHHHDAKQVHEALSQREGALLAKVSRFIPQSGNIPSSFLKGPFATHSRDMHGAHLEIFELYRDLSNSLCCSKSGFSILFLLSFILSCLRTSVTEEESAILLPRRVVLEEAI